MPLFISPFLIVSVKGFLGVDIFELGFSEKVILNLTVSTFLIAVIIVFFLKLFPNKKLKDSVEFMRELVEFENHDNL